MAKTPKNRLANSQFSLKSCNYRNHYPVVTAWSKRNQWEVPGSSVILVEAPGYEAHELFVTVDNYLGQIVIYGEHKEQPHCENDFRDTLNLNRSFDVTLEIPYSAYVDIHGTPEYRNGILEIEVVWQLIDDAPTMRLKQPVKV